MSARKLALVPSQPAPTLQAVEAELLGAQQALRAAGAAVDSARAALDTEPDFARRPMLREVLIQAEKDLEAAQGALPPIQARLNVTQRHEDERAALALAERIGNAAQFREADADADEFVREVGGAIQRFFERISKRNLAFRDEADQLNVIWERLGHEHKIPGVRHELGTATESIPPRVSVDGLHSFEALALQKLEHLPPQATPVQQAVRLFLRGALEHTGTLAALKQTVAHNHNLRAEAANNKRNGK